MHNLKKCTYVILLNKSKIWLTNKLYKLMIGEFIAIEVEANNLTQK